MVGTNTCSYILPKWGLLNCNCINRLLHELRMNCGLIVSSFAEKPQPLPVRDKLSCQFLRMMMV